MSSVPQKIMTQYKFILMDADAKRLGGGVRVGSMRTPASIKDVRKILAIFDPPGGSKIAKILRTSFMDGPEVNRILFTLTVKLKVKYHIYQYD